MRNLIVLFILGFFISPSFAQISYKTEILKPNPITQVVDMSIDKAEFNPFIKFTEIHSPGKTNLKALKEVIDQKYPRDPSAAFQRKKMALPPELLNGFNANSFQGGTPLDNHVCVSDGGQILSAINSNISMRNTDGTLIRNRTIDSFTGEIQDGVAKYDPRVIYDPTSDRFIFVCLSGFASTTSNIVLGCSVTNEINGEWNFYVIDGNPFNNGRWTDYPMLSISETELFLTINLITDNESWQEGFNETLVYQINLNSIYNGEDMLSRMWSDITFDGKPLRNLCPVKYADEIRADNMFLLSNRNFDMTNDSIFIIEIEGKFDDPNTGINISSRVTDTPYGAPANAIDGNGFLQTNDARVLDAIIIDDQIQFVGNTRNHDTGFTDVYHGIIEDVYDTKTVTGEYVGNVDYDLGYPGIAWTGVTFADKDVIMVMTHTSATKFPGISAVYFNNDREYSELLEIRQGDGTIAESGTSRWGDYIGIQRKYNQPGVVFTAGTYGSANNQPFTWVNKVASPNTDLSDVSELEKIKSLKVFPNPTVQSTEVQFEINQSKRIEIDLFDINGQLIKTLFRDHPKKLGLVDFRFDLTPLSAGTYFLKVKIGNQLIKTEKVVKI